MQKTCIVFYTGYSPCFSEFFPDTKCYGSELCTRNIAENLVKCNYEVHIFSDGNIISNVSNGVNYHNFQYYNQFQDKFFELHNRKIDVLVISRYINFFIYCIPKVEKIFFWSHDTTVQPYYGGVKLFDEGSYFLLNVLDKIDRYIVLSETHRIFVFEWLQKVRTLTDSEKEKFIVIGNGLDYKLFENLHKVRRIPNRFIYCSDPTRGLSQALDVLEIVYKEEKNITLEVYYADVSEDLKKRIKELPFVHLNGKVEQKDLIVEMCKSEFLMYPSFFFETYCMVALECQMAGVIPIVHKTGALIDTVGDRGISIAIKGNTPEDYKELINELAIETLKLIKDETRKKEFRKKGIEFAKNQTYKKIVKRWIKFIEQDEKDDENEEKQTE